MVFVQRFDSALRLNLHFHALVLDGSFDGSDPMLGFHAAPRLTDAEAAWATRQIHAKVLRLLQRQGRLADTDAPAVDPTEEPEPLSTCYAAAIQGRIAFGPKAAWPVVRLGEPTENEVEFRRGKLCAELCGFSLHARVWLAACARERLETLCRYVARPPLCTERLQQLADGKVLCRLKRTWSDGSKAVVMEPGTLLERLCALVPRPRQHLVTYHGVLAPAATLRKQVVAQCPHPSRASDRWRRSVAEPRPAPSNPS